MKFIRKKLDFPPAKSHYPLRDRWRDITVNLSAYAGSEIMLELLNASNDWAYEIALWAKIQIDSD